jgi:hypothetical protein
MVRPIIAAVCAWMQVRQETGIPAICRGIGPTIATIGALALC